VQTIRINLFWKWFFSSTTALDSEPDKIQKCVNDFKQNITGLDFHNALIQMPALDTISDEQATQSSGMIG